MIYIIYLHKYIIKSKQARMTRIIKGYYIIFKQVDVFPYLKTWCLCVLLQYKYTI